MLKITPDDGFDYVYRPLRGIKAYLAKTTTRKAIEHYDKMLQVVKDLCVANNNQAFWVCRLEEGKIPPFQVR